jgi:hypothetical protein
MQSWLRTKARNYAQFCRPCSCARTRRTTPCMPTPTAISPTSTAISFRSATRASTGRSRSTAAIRPPNGKGLHAVKDTITLFNPANGWIQNTNNWPFSAAGPDSPRKQDYPAYMWSLPENARGVHAVRVLQGAKDLTLDGLIAAALRPVPDGLRHADPAAARRLRCAAGRQSAQGRAGAAGRGAARMGPPLRLRFDRDFARGVLGPGPAGTRRRAGEGEGGADDRLHRHRPGAGRISRCARTRQRETGAGLRQVEYAVGRDQPLPTAHRGHRAALRRQQAEPAGRVDLVGNWGSLAAFGMPRGPARPGASTATAATVSSRRWSSVRACRRRACWRAASAATRPRRISPTRRRCTASGRVQAGAVLPRGYRAERGADVQAGGVGRRNLQRRWNAWGGAADGGIRGVAAIPPYAPKPPSAPGCIGWDSRAAGPPAYPTDNAPKTAIRLGFHRVGYQGHRPTGVSHRYALKTAICPRLHRVG